MSAHRSKIVQSMKEYSNNPKLKKNIDNIENSDEKIKANRPNIKVDYKSSNYFYNDEDYFKEYPYKRIEYYNSNDNRGKYNIESNSSHITVENEDGIIKYIPNKPNYNYNYNNYNDISSKKNNKYVEINNNKNNDYYDDNSDYSENNEYYENDEYENENGIINNNSPRIKYKQLQENINYYLAPNAKQIKKKNQNIMNKAISHEINYSSEKNVKVRQLKKNMHKCGNNTTTNNTYNNNIYYINPINVKNKNKLKEKNNLINNINNRKNTNNRKNFIYKSVDITLQKRRNREREKDYFKFNNIDKNQRKLFIKAAILIQSIFRGYLVKIKLYNNVNLYVCCKRGIDILEELLLRTKNEYWAIFKDNIYNNSYKNKRFNNSPNYSIRSKYKLKHNKIKESLNSFYKEKGDSFFISNRNININKDNINEKKLKSKLNIVIRENNILKKQLIDSKNIELKLKLLIDENKKNQNINSIIMKDNMQLAKKLKDLQDYRNHRLFIENQYSIDLNQMEKLQIQELNKSNELISNKIKLLMLEKILYKKIYNENKIIKEKLYKYRNIVQQLKEKDIENNNKKEICLKNLINIIGKIIKLSINKSFWYIYYNGLALEKEKEEKENKINEILKKIIYKKEQKDKILLHKMFFKFFINNLKYKNEEIIKKKQKEEEEEKKILKVELLQKLFRKYENSSRFIYKVILEKWNLKAKLIGIKTAARDKKKKRKQKKKNNRLFNKNFGFGENNNKKNYAPLCKSIHEFSYIVSNGKLIKESNPNESGRVLLGNKSTKNIITKNDDSNLNDNELKKKKNKSVNKNIIFKIKKDSNNKYNNNNDDYYSEEESGDSFGLGNNSD